MFTLLFTAFDITCKMLFIFLPCLNPAKLKQGKEKCKDNIDGNIGDNHTPLKGMQHKLFHNNIQQC